MNSELEDKWQEIWDKNRIFEPNPDDREKFFITIPYPYLNGNLHIGHARTFVIGDLMARYKRMKGYNVLFPMAFHVTGTPIVALAELIAKEDERTIKVYNTLHKIPMEILLTLDTPEKIVDYFKVESEMALRKIGCSIDWRRKFTTTDSPYKRFITWQFKKLRDKGYVSKGSHPVRWCPNCGNPVEDHDILRGEDANIINYVLIKFSADGSVIPCATLRPETVFGATNLWVNPEYEYIIAEIDNERWIISSSAYKKLSFLNKNPLKIGTIKGSQLVGRSVKNPINDDELIILPASFVDPDDGTGIVMSVPAHAPYDYLALNDLKEKTYNFGMTNEILDVVERIKPIKLINVPEFNGIPAVDIVKKLGVKNQKDKKAENATKILYKKEFHEGVLNETTGSYAGLSCSKARDVISEDLIKKGYADILYDLSEPVTCRCGTECTVKLVEDQWFLTYSKKEWKDLVLECLNSMSIIPEEYRREFENKIDWLKDKACARKKGLGTRLPWDKEWLIESLADSTIYMAYYTIAKFLSDGRLKEDDMDDEFFDYVFLGIGSPKKEIYTVIREEFDYWYPVDLRSSGKDLVSNHLLFFLFHHVAIFPKKHWPKAIAVNGFVSLEGERMSKSKGPLLTIKEILDEFGADVTRFYILSNSEHTQDADWRYSNVKDAKKALNRFYRLAEEIVSNSRDEYPNSGIDSDKMTKQDRWIIHRCQIAIRDVESAIEDMKTRKALQSAFYSILNDVKWYKKRGEDPQVLREVLKIWVRLLAPFIPHTSEEIWSWLSDVFVSVSDFPTVDERFIDFSLDLEEDLVRRTIDDIKEILAVIKISPTRIIIYTAPEWKNKIYSNAIKLRKNGELNMNLLMEEIKKDHQPLSKKVSNLAKNVIRDVELMDPSLIDILSNVTIDEHSTIKNATDFMEREIGCKIEVYDAKDVEYDPMNKKDAATFLKPAIYIE